MSNYFRRNASRLLLVKDRKILIDSVYGKPLQTQIIDRDLLFDIKIGSLNERARIIWQISESDLKEIKTGYISFGSFKTSISLYPQLNLYFNNELVTDWEYAYPNGKYLKDWMYKPEDETWGRINSLIYELGKRKCILEFPAIFVFNIKKGQSNVGQIYSRIPSYADLENELRLKKWIY